MNCRPGDLATFVPPFKTRIVGKLCRVIGPPDEPMVLAGWVVKADSAYGPVWMVEWYGDAPMYHEVGVQLHVGPVPDAWLKPLRDEQGEDQALQRARLNIAGQSCSN